MKRDEFINELKKELNGIAMSEVEDIIRDQEEFIREAVNAGRTEEAVIQSLGHPRDLAKSLRAEIKLDKVTSEKKLSKQVRGAFGAVAALLVLAPFNLIFVLGPFLALVGVTLGGWAAVLGLNVAALAAMAVFLFVLIFLPVGTFVHLATFFTILGCIGITILLCVAMYFITKAFVKLILSYLKWNLNFIKGQA